MRIHRLDKYARLAERLHSEGYTRVDMRVISEERLIPDTPRDWVECSIAVVMSANGGILHRENVGNKQFYGIASSLWLDDRKKKAWGITDKYDGAFKEYGISTVYHFPKICQPLY